MLDDNIGCGQRGVAFFAFVFFDKGFEYARAGDCWRAWRGTCGRFSSGREVAGADFVLPSTALLRKLRLRAGNMPRSIR